MPKITKDSKYVSAELVKTGDFLTFVDEGVEVEKKDFNQEDVVVLEITVSLPNGDQKIYSLKGGNKNRMIDAYGDDTSQWIGKKARCWVNTKQIAGVWRDILDITAENKNLKGETI